MTVAPRRVGRDRGRGTTGCGEILDGRVKIPPGGPRRVLADRDQPAHLQLLADRRYLSFDLVAVNFYPFLKLNRGVTTAR